jgi:ABC-2 type transport system ATP-binding protein
VLHGPDLLLFDGPTSGLDPESSHAVLEMIREMTAEGTTVIMCTHLLMEAEGLADQVVVLEGGQARVAGAPDELTQRFWPNTVVVVDAEDHAHLAGLKDIPGVRSVTTVPGGGADGALQVSLDDPKRVPDLVAALISHGARLTRVEPHVPTLEDLYFAVRGRSETADDGGRQLSPSAPRPAWASASPPPPPPPPPPAKTRPTELEGTHQ